MPRCKHEKNWKIEEFGTAHLSHDYEHGELTHNSQTDDLTGMAVFECKECGLMCRFSTLGKLPRKWLADRMNKATGTDRWQS